MAAGRGQFFRSFLDGLEQTAAQPAPGGQLPGRGRGQTRRRMNERPPRAAAATGFVSGNGPSCTNAKTQHTANPPVTNTSLPQENFIERLPSEILTIICSYLDASSLFCVSHVSRLFHQVANDNGVWHKLYMSDFGSTAWKPKMAYEATPKVELVEARHLPTGDLSKGNLSAEHWKRIYTRTLFRNVMGPWMKELRDVSQYTGLPRRTEWVLRKLNVTWELTLFDHLGQKTTLEQNKAFFFESSVVVRWCGSWFPKYCHIRNMQVHGVRKDMQKSGKDEKPGWRSLISELNMKTRRGCFIGKDRLINLLHLPAGFIVGIWRGQSSIAFVMVSLHFYQLVEKSVLGNPVCPYLPPVGKSLSLFSLDTYSVHFVLHNTGTEIVSANFPHISFCCKASLDPFPPIQNGLVELILITKKNLSHHRPLSGDIKLLWKSEELEGSVENCCIITLTLLDKDQKPFWCVSSPICIKMAKKKLSSDYNGVHYLMEHREPDGQVKMKFVWLKEQKQFFLISLIVYISVSKLD